ncbi:MAG TPA: EamA family transporter [Ignavibacteriaceae bacterium]|nr:EamA family transporter [Ignavibacteriaceae bacterium]
MTWYYLALISAVFSALAAISEKRVLFRLNALDFSFFVSIITLILSIPFFFDAPLNLSLSTPLIILFLKAILSALAFLCVMLAIKNLEISEALPLLALSPGLVAVLGVLFIQDTLLFNEWIGISLMLIGTYILELKKDDKSIFDPFKSLLRFNKYKYIFFALILFSITSLIDRVLLKDFKLPPYTFMAYQQLFFALIFTTMVLIRKKKVNDIFKTLNKNVIYLILLISLFTVIYRYTQIEATKIAAVALVLSVKRLSVLMAVIIGGKLFKESNVLKRLIAAVIILTGLVILVNS